jgi:methylenetetrahydrofolate--tRNA-(uracil-5-)-methyltransferase
MHAAALATGGQPVGFPRETALGSLCHYVSGADASNYQPANITFDLLPQLDDATRQELRRDKKARHAEVCRRALEALERSGHIEEAARFGGAEQSVSAAVAEHRGGAIE